MTEIVVGILAFILQIVFMLCIFLPFMLLCVIAYILMLPFALTIAIYRMIKDCKKEKNEEVKVNE